MSDSEHLTARQVYLQTVVPRALDVIALFVMVLFVGVLLGVATRKLSEWFSKEDQ